MKSKHLHVSKILFAVLATGGMATLVLPISGVEGFTPPFGANLSAVACYAAVALAVGALAFLAANWIRPADAAAPDHIVGFSVIAGVIWPVLVIALVQLAALAGARRLALMAAQSDPQSSPLRPQLAGIR